MKAKTDADTTSGNRTIIEGGILHSPNALIINANCAHCPMAATIERLTEIIERLTATIENLTKKGGAA